MTLQQEHIQIIDNYIEKSGIVWLDLKLELVDHFVLKVEDTLSHHPELDIHAAIHKVKLGFGPKGFTPIINERRKHIEKQFFKSVFKHFKSFVTLPKIIFTLLLTYGLIRSYSLIAARDKEWFFIGLIMVLFFASVNFIFNAYNRRKIANSKLLVLHHMQQFSSLANTLAAGLNLLYIILKKDFLEHNNYMLFISIWVIMFLFSVSIEVISKQIFKQQQSIYSKYIV